MRVNFILTGDEMGGVRSFTLSIARGIIERGYKVRVICYRNGKLIQELRAIHVSVIKIPARDTKWRFLNTRLALLARFISSRSRSNIDRCRLLDIPHTNDDILVFPKLQLLLEYGALFRDVGWRCLWFMHNAMGDYPLGVNRIIAKSFVSKWKISVAGNSRYTVNSLHSLKIKRFVHLGVDVNKFKPSRNELLKSQLGIPNGVPVFGLFGTVTKNKGQWYCLDAIKRLVADGYSLYVIFAGGGGLEANRFKNACNSESIQAHCKYLGEREDISELYGVIDVGINAYDKGEAFGLSVVECLSSGLPCLVYPKGGPAETVIDGYTGWFINEPGYKGLVCGIKRAIHSREKWSVMGTKARADAIKRFSKKNFIDNFIDLIKKID